MLTFIRISLCLLLFAHPCLLKADDASLELLITAIQEQEQHYDELEYVVTEQFERSQEEGLNDDLGTSDILVNEIRAEYSLRDGRWVYHVDELSHYLLSDSHRTYSGLWNGDACYMLGEVVVTDAANGQTTDRLARGYVWEYPRTIAYPRESQGARFLRPHSAITQPCPLSVPLSVWLGGRDSMMATGFEAYNEVAVRDLGDTEWQGLDCRHLLVETRSLETTEDTVNVDIELWLAKERNLIPVHAVLYRVKGGQSLQVAQLTITDWHEISAGVFFPKTVREEEYDNELGESEGRIVVRAHKDSVVESVSTNCTRPEEDFESFAFPEGVEVLRR